MRIRACSNPKDLSIKKICDTCGNDTVKKCFGFFRAMDYRNKDKYLSYVFDEKAFYVAMEGKDHIRLIVIAVDKESQGRGLGKMALNHLKQLARLKGKHKITLKTEMDKPAFEWWLKQGARVVKKNNSEVEMEIVL